MLWCLYSCLPLWSPALLIPTCTTHCTFESCCANMQYNLQSKFLVKKFFLPPSLHFIFSWVPWPYQHHHHRFSPPHTRAPLWACSGQPTRPLQSPSGVLPSSARWPGTLCAWRHLRVCMNVKTECSIDLGVNQIIKIQNYSVVFPAVIALASPIWACRSQVFYCIY